MSRYISKTLKLQIDERDLGLCRYCGCIPEIKEYDHIIPYSSGGLTNISNLVLSCFDCNRDKSDATWIPIPIGQTWGKDQRFREKSAKPYRGENHQKRQYIKRGKRKEKTKPHVNRTCTVCKENGSNRKPVYGRKSVGLYYHLECMNGIKTKEQPKEKTADTSCAIKVCFVCNETGADKEGNVKNLFYHESCTK